MFQTFDTHSSRASSAERVAALRVLMAKHGFDALLVPRADEHQNEYVPANRERLAFITGFTGSSGLGVVATEAGALFVDGRYTLQAPGEVDPSIFEVCGIRTNDLMPWLTRTLSRGARIGFDPRLHTIAEVELLRDQMTKPGFLLKATKDNLVDKVWGSDRPADPQGCVVVQPLEFAGVTPREKIAQVQKTLVQAGQGAALITAPDNICWLFNIRGSDVAHNPIVLAFTIVPASGRPELFVDPAKLTREVRDYLEVVAVLKSSEALGDALEELASIEGGVRVSPQTSWWCVKGIGRKHVHQAADPCNEAKAIKNAAEIAGARQAHVRDGVAVTRFLAWFDGAMTQGEVDEIGAVTTLEALRAESGVLKEISFPTIAGSGAHGAIVHYRVTRESNRTIQPGELFLLDSGAQYADGTTDITRTIATGTPRAEMAERFTLVLKGMIALSVARFPRGTRGIDLDPLARRALWAHGFNYDHGTGHGVGSYLSVHEGPQSISKAGMSVLQPGMICSNEPGYYKAHQYGIRIENLVLVAEPRDVGGDQPVLSFETLTLVPIDRRLIVTTLLTDEERDWIDAYHKLVASTLSPYLDTKTRRWLKQATAKL